MDKRSEEAPGRVPSKRCEVTPGCYMPFGHVGRGKYPCRISEPPTTTPAREQSGQFLSFPRIIPEADRVPISDDEY